MCLVCSVTDRPQHLTGFILLFKSSWQVGRRHCTAQSFRDSGRQRDLHLRCVALTVHVARERKGEMGGHMGGFGEPGADFATQPHTWMKRWSLWGVRCGYGKTLPRDHTWVERCWVKRFLAGQAPFHNSARHWKRRWTSNHLCHAALGITLYKEAEDLPLPSWEGLRQGFERRRVHPPCIYTFLCTYGPCTL